MRLQSDTHIQWKQGISFNKMNGPNGCIKRKYNLGGRKKRSINIQGMFKAKDWVIYEDCSAGTGFLNE